MRSDSTTQGDAQDGMGTTTRAFSRAMRRVATSACGPRVCVVVGVLLLAGLSAPLASGCDPTPDVAGAASTSPTASAADGTASSASGPTMMATKAALARPRAASRAGSTIARGARDEALYVADEDHAALRVFKLPLDDSDGAALALPGRPAQVVALADRILVTVRDPGLLVSVVNDEAGLRIAQSVPIAADAWGLAVTGDERTAIITSAWTHTVTAVDLASGEPRWALDVAREPRGVVVLSGEDRAYVTHLTSATLTRVDGVAGSSPTATALDLPAGPLGVLAAGDDALGASLAYAPVLSADGARLFVPRHALGSVGWEQWFGRPTVDVLLTRDDTPLAPEHSDTSFDANPTAPREPDDLVPMLPLHWTTQPRAAVYRSSSHTLLVASEAEGRVTELDARALDPSLHPVYRYELTHGADDADRCGAPSGLALAADEREVYVWCRSTREIAHVVLRARSFTRGPDADPTPPSFVHVAGDEGTDPELQLGRRLFFDGRSDSSVNAGIAGGLGCAGCHPDGRDDGHVWLETREGGVVATSPFRRSSFFASDPLHPRQTPTLAGRVAPRGPYGWRGESATLDERVRLGFAIHRWDGSRNTAQYPTWVKERAPQSAALARYLREGLVPPPSEARALTTLEARGRDLFGRAGCDGCHDESDGFSSRLSVTLELPLFVAPEGEAERTPFRIPSLLFAGGTAPYFHDGRYASLDDMLARIGDGMGHTSDLSADDRSALAAYVRSIGSVLETDGRVDELPRATSLPFSGALEEEETPVVGAPESSSFALDPPTGPPSSEPTRDEWEHASKEEFVGMSDGCSASRVREWIRIVCEPELDRIETLGLVSGDRKDVRLVLESRHSWSGEGVMIFPVRRGDRRTFELDRHIVLGTQCSKYEKWFRAAGFTVSEAWVDGEAPEIVVTRYGRHPSTGRLVMSHTCP